MSGQMSWRALYPGRTPEEGPPSEEECEAAARAALERGYPQTTVYGDGASAVHPDEEAVVAYRWDSNRGGHRTSNIWCVECNAEFQQRGTADADLTARDITPGQTCDVCGKDILTDPKASKEPTT